MSSQNEETEEIDDSLYEFMIIFFFDYLQKINYRDHEIFKNSNSKFFKSIIKYLDESEEIIDFSKSSTEIDSNIIKYIKRESPEDDQNFCKVIQNIFQSLSNMKTQENCRKCYEIYDSDINKKTNLCINHYLNNKRIIKNSVCENPKCEINKFIEIEKNNKTSVSNINTDFWLKNLKNSQKLKEKLKKTNNENTFAYLFKKVYFSKKKRKCPYCKETTMNRHSFLDFRDKTNKNFFFMIYFESESEKAAKFRDFEQILSYKFKIQDLQEDFKENREFNLTGLALKSKKGKFVFYKLIRAKEKEKWIRITTKEREKIGEAKNNLFDLITEKEKKYQILLLLYESIKSQLKSIIQPSSNIMAQNSFSKTISNSFFDEKPILVEGNNSIYINQQSSYINEENSRDLAESKKIKNKNEKGKKKKYYNVEDDSD